MPKFAAFRSGIDAKIKAAKGLTPVELSNWPSFLCHDTARSRPADWVTDTISRHVGQSSDNDRVPIPITFRDMRLEGDLKLPDGLDLDVAFENVSMCGDIRLGGTFKRPLSFKNVVVTKHRAPGLVVARRAEFKNSLALESLTVGSIDLDKVKAAEEIDLTSSLFGHLKLSRSQISDLLMSSTAQLNDVHEKFLMAEPVRDFREQRPPGAIVELTSAKISGQVYGDWSRIEGAISAQRLETEVLRFQIAQIAHADFRYIRADVVSLGGATLGRENADPLPACGLTSALINDPRILSFEGARVAGDFRLMTRIINAMGKFPTVVNQRLCLNAMVVEGQVKMAGLNAHILDMTGLRVGRALQLASKDRGPVVWKDASTAQLSLSHARLERVSLSEELLSPSTFELTGTSIGSIENNSDPAKQPRAHIVLSDMIASLPNPNARIPAYRVLETTLTKLGDTDGAKEMAFERLRSQTNAMCWFCSASSFFHKLLAKSSELLGGYGIKPERTLACAIMMVLLGALVAGAHPAGRGLVVARLRIPVGRRRLAFELLLLSFDRLIPLVALDKLYSEWVFSDLTLRCYFILHAITGLLIAGSVVTYVGRSFGFSD